MLTSLFLLVVLGALGHVNAVLGEDALCVASGQVQALTPAIIVLDDDLDLITRLDLKFITKGGGVGGDDGVDLGGGGGGTGGSDEGGGVSGAGATMTSTTTTGELHGVMSRGGGGVMGGFVGGGKDNASGGDGVTGGEGSFG